jgi:hypothetical protein
VGTVNAAVQGGVGANRIDEHFSPVEIEQTFRNFGLGILEIWKFGNLGPYHNNRVSQIIRRLGLGCPNNRLLVDTAQRP